MDKASGIYVDLPSGKLLSYSVQSLCDLSKVCRALQLLALDFVGRLLDGINARLHLPDLFILFSLSQKLVQFEHKSCQSAPRLLHLLV